MLQRYYKPDGWLDFLFGSKLYINFDGKFPFDEAYMRLQRELKNQLTHNKGQDQVDGTLVIVDL